MFLQQHTDLIVTKSDKGNLTVVLNSTDYNNLSLSLLSDRKYYLPLTRDPTSTLEQKANRLITNLKSSGKIDDGLSKRLHKYNSTAPRFYALPKVHKPTLSLRPIISSINAPNSNIEKFLTSILTKAYDTSNEHYISDSFSFSSFINDFQLPPDYILISLDVVSLFTNLPLILAKNIITKKWNTIQPHTTLDLQSFVKLLDFTFDSTYFIFDNKFFKQVFGTPMGASISPIISSYVMDDLISNAIETLPFQIPFLKRYVDDLILSVPRNMVKLTLELFNKQNEFIQFTSEEESANKIPFLDMLLLRNNANIVNTKWYRKPISSGRYLNFHSGHPLKMKLGIVSAMRSRVLRLTHPEFHDETLTQLSNLFMENSYPPKLLHRLLFSTPRQISLNNRPITLTHHTEQNSQPQVTFMTLPFYKDLTPRLINVFRGMNFKFATNLPNKLKFLYTKLKTPILKEQKTNIVYNLPCASCNLSYIGQTSRSLKGRITSHKSDCRRGILSCSLAQHVIQKDHIINFSEASILFNEPNYVKRKFLEMVAINNNPYNMNERTDTEDLSLIYSYLLKLHRDGNITSNSIDSQ